MCQPAMRWQLTRNNVMLSLREMSGKWVKITNWPKWPSWVFPPVMFHNTSSGCSTKQFSCISIDNTQWVASLGSTVSASSNKRLIWLKAARPGKSELLKGISRQKTYFPAIGSVEYLDCVTAAWKPQPHIVSVKKHLFEWADMLLANICNGGG